VKPACRTKHFLTTRRIFRINISFRLSPLHHRIGQPDGTSLPFITAAGSPPPWFPDVVPAGSNRRPTLVKFPSTCAETEPSPAHSYLTASPPNHLRDDCTCSRHPYSLSERSFYHSHMDLLLLLMCISLCIETSWVEENYLGAFDFCRKTDYTRAYQALTSCLYISTLVGNLRTPLKPWHPLHRSDFPANRFLSASLLCSRPLAWRAMRIFRAEGPDPLLYDSRTTMVKWGYLGYRLKNQPDQEGLRGEVDNNEERTSNQHIQIEVRNGVMGRRLVDMPT